MNSINKNKTPKAGILTPSIMKPKKEKVYRLSSNASTSYLDDKTFIERKSASIIREK